MRPTAATVVREDEGPSQDSSRVTPRHASVVRSLTNAWKCADIKKFSFCSALRLSVVLLDINGDHGDLERDDRRSQHKTVFYVIG
jgi:hypothetical protein